MFEAFEKYPQSLKDKLDNFEKYIRRERLARFLARYELFKMQIPLKGSILECGVHHGGGLLAWAKMSAALEPYAYNRRIFGFDTFEGFPAISGQDSTTKMKNDDMKVGGFDTKFDIYAELQEIIKEYNDNRFLNQFEKVFLVKGDATKTIPQFIEDNPYLVISLLFLDFDLYEPTKVALEYFLPRMGKGSILVFDEINNPWWPGETQALMEKIDLRQLEIRKFSFDPNIAYIVM